MGDVASAQNTPLPYTFASWVFQLHIAGVAPCDGALQAACADVDAATDEETGEVAGEALVTRVTELLDGGEAERVLAVARTLYGDRANGALGEGDRAARTHRIRRYQFERQLPWLARIWERHLDGGVKPTWLLVERVTDQVSALDPNPWNEIDETRDLPVSDFQVLWELGDCQSVSLS